MGSGNITYNVVIYTGEFYSHDRRVVYSSGKRANAEKFLHEFLKTHDEVQKAYIEARYGRQAGRDLKHMREEDE